MARESRAAEVVAALMNRHLPPKASPRPTGADRGGSGEPQLEFAVTRVGYLMRVKLSGEFDFSSEERFNRFWRALVFEPGELISFDLDDLDFVDIQGCVSFSRCVRRLRAAGARVEVVNACDAVMDAFEATGQITAIENRH